MIGGARFWPAGRGQMAAALALDHYGLLGFPVRPLDAWRIAGVVLVIAGVFLSRGGSEDLKGTFTFTSCRVRDARRPDEGERPLRFAPRLLLRDAVDVAAAEQDLARRHANDLAAREQLRERGLGRAVGPRIEQRHHDVPVRDVEIHVRAGEPVACAARLASGERSMPAASASLM